MTADIIMYSQWIDLYIFGKYNVFYTLQLLDKSTKSDKSWWRQDGITMDQMEKG